MSTPPSSVRAAALPFAAEARVYDDAGVDLTLIRAFLRQTPIERLRSLQNMVQALQRFRRIPPLVDEG